MRNVYFVYIFKDSNTSEIRHNGEIKTLNGIDILPEIELSQESVVFINEMFFITHRYPGGKSSGDNYYKFGRKETLEYIYDKVTFRNIVCFTNGQSEELLKELYPDVSVTEAMEMYISTLGNPEKVKYTLGYHTKKMFYQDIRDFLWQFKKEHKAYYYKVETYEDMMVGNKAGALCNDPMYAENVLCFDKRSAYASVMVNDDKFPIGQMRKTEIEKERHWYLLDLIDKYMENGTYFKIVCDYIIPGFSVFYDEKVKKTGLEYENILDLMEDGRLEEFLNNIGDCRIYYCTETGRLPYELRCKIIECFDNKESMTGVAKFFEKTKINIIYGKGIQHYDFKDKYDMQRHYKGRGENYLNPEQSLHCHAVLLHEIHKAIRNNVAIYWDTDGIKVKDTPEARNYFENQNNIIRQKNIDAGFESEIGTWKLEFEDEQFISFGPKQYLQKHKNGEYEITWCGIEKRDQEKMLQSLGDDKIIKAIVDGVPVLQRYYYINPDNCDEIFCKYTVEKKEYEGQ